MKKIYQKPETEVIRMELQQMIALSKTDEPADPNSEVLSRRRGSSWSDEGDFE